MYLSTLESLNTKKNDVTKLCKFILIRDKAILPSLTEKKSVRKYLMIKALKD